MKIVSIILASYSVERLSKCLTSVKNTVSDYSNIEIIVAINHDNEILKEYILSQQSELPIRYITTPYGYYESQHNYNTLLVAGDQNTKFVHCISDRFRYITAGWDIILAGKIYENVGYYGLNNVNSRYTSFTQAHYNTNLWAIYSREWLNKLGGFYNGYYCHDCSMDMIQYFIDRQSKKFNNYIQNLYPVRTFHIKWEVDESRSHGILIDRNQWFRHLKSNQYVIRKLFSQKGMQDICNIASSLTNIYFKIGFFEALYEKLRKRKYGHGAEFVRIFDFALRYIPGFYRMAHSNGREAKVLMKCLCLLFWVEKPHRLMLKDPEFRKVWLDGKWKKIN